MVRTYKWLLWLAVVSFGLSFFATPPSAICGQTLTPKAIENLENPKYSGKDAPELIFKQELSIPLKGGLYSFDVDDAGNIYLLDIFGAIVTVYDKDGKIISKFGKKGQGPGEFGNPVCLALSKNNRIHILDRSRKTIQIFDPNGNPLDHRLLSSVGVLNSLSFDSAGSVYVQHMLARAALKEGKRLGPQALGLSCLSKFDSRFDKVMDIDAWEDSFRRKLSSGGVLYVLYHDVFYYQIGSDDTLYCGHSSAYEIRQMTPQGQVTRIIKKKSKRIPTVQKDFTRILEEHPDLEQAKDSIRMSDTKPLFADFHILENIGLLVGTYEDEWNDKEVLSCDLFDQKGAYLARVTAPRYYLWSQHAVDWEKRNRLFKNGKCYSIAAVEKGEALALVRHAFELKWPQEMPPRLSD